MLLDFLSFLEFFWVAGVFFCSDPTSSPCRGACSATSFRLQGRRDLQTHDLMSWVCRAIFPRIRGRKMSTDSFCTNFQIWEREKPINIKNFGGTPPGVRPVCPGDTSHLSRGMSRLSRGHSVPLDLYWFTHKSGPNVPGVPGTSRVCPWDASGASRPPNSFMWFFFIGFFLSPIFSLLQQKTTIAATLLRNPPLWQRKGKTTPTVTISIRNLVTPHRDIWTPAGIPEGPGIEKIRSRPSGLKISSARSWIELFDWALLCDTRRAPWIETPRLVATCSWEFNRGRGRGWESRPLSRSCFALVLKGF